MGKVVVLDNGHGGTINGVYQTAGKRSPNWHYGVLYEGVFNRWVVRRIIEKLDRLKIPYYYLTPEQRDISLPTRVKRSDRIYKENQKTWLLSVHANGGGGYGTEGFTSYGHTTSDGIMDIVLKDFENNVRGVSGMRYDKSDGDLDKESGFYILRKPIMPSGLIEIGFMDNLSDYNNLENSKFLDSVVNSLVISIIKIYNA